MKTSKGSYRKYVFNICDLPPELVAHIVGHIVQYTEVKNDRLAAYELSQTSTFFRDEVPAQLKFYINALTSDSGEEIQEFVENQLTAQAVAIGWHAAGGDLARVGASSPLITDLSAWELWAQRVDFRVPRNLQTEHIYFTPAGRQYMRCHAIFQSAVSEANIDMDTSIVPDKFCETVSCVSYSNARFCQMEACLNVDRLGGGNPFIPNTYSMTQRLTGHQIRSKTTREFFKLWLHLLAALRRRLHLERRHWIAALLSIRRGLEVAADDRVLEVQLKIYQDLRPGEDFQRVVPKARKPLLPMIRSQAWATWGDSEPISLVDEWKQAGEREHRIRSLVRTFEERRTAFLDLKPYLMITPDMRSCLEKLDLIWRTFKARSKVRGRKGRSKSAPRRQGSTADLNAISSMVTNVLEQRRIWNG